MPLFRILTLLLLLLLSANVVVAQAPPERLVPNEVERLGDGVEHVRGLGAGLLVSPANGANATDGKYSQPYHAACFAYAAEALPNSNDVVAYARRFAVHAPDADTLPLAKRVARLLLLIHGDELRRLRLEHTLNGATVDVWLTRSAGQGLGGDVGGEQFKNQIYLYDIFGARTPIEWTREIAHEYGHYILPGVSGFTEPENWANGVLGERLFLKWLSLDLASGSVKPDELTFATPAEIDEYVARQVDPLVRKVAKEGVDPKLLAKTNAAAMDAYTGLSIYLALTYGDRALLDAMSYAAPKSDSGFVQATDFLIGVIASLVGATELTVEPPLRGKGERSFSFEIYVPRGDWTIVPQTGVKWELPEDAKGLHRIGKAELVVNIGDWRKLTLTRTGTGDAPPTFVLRRAGAEVR